MLGRAAPMQDARSRADRIGQRRSQPIERLIVGRRVVDFLRPDHSLVHSPRFPDTGYTQAHLAALQKSDIPRSNHWKNRSEEHTSELQSLMRISNAVSCMKKKKHNILTITQQI